MATLTRYTTFKSLKKDFRPKEKQVSDKKKLATDEVEAFFQMLNKKNAKAKKA